MLHFDHTIRQIREMLASLARKKSRQLYDLSADEKPDIESWLRTYAKSYFLSRL